jgi:hypothetical protein
MFNLYVFCFIKKNDREEFETAESEPMELTTEQLQNQRTVSTHIRYAILTNDDESDDEYVESTPEPQQNPIIIPERFFQTSSDSDILEPDEQPTYDNEVPQTEDSIQSNDLILNNSIFESYIQPSYDHDAPRIDASTQSKDNNLNFPLALRLEDLNFDTSSEDESYQPSSSETSFIPGN